MAELSYSELRRIQEEERKSNSLVNVPEDFYGKVEALLSEKKRTVEAKPSLIEMREYENLLKIVREIRTLREQKIVFRALKVGKRETSGLSKEEREFYERILAVVEEERKRMDALFLKTTKKEEPMLKKVKMLTDIPAFKGSDNLIYGPFKLGQEEELPFYEAEFLIKGKLAKEF